MQKSIFQKLAVTTLGVTFSFGMLEASFERPAVAVSQYTITDLGTLGGNFSYANGINNSGQVVGYSDNPDGNFHAFRTAANSPINQFTDDLGTLGGSLSYAYGINNSGQVVGYSPTSGINFHAFRTAANSVINPSTDDLGTLGSNYSRAYGINDSGQVVGDSITSTNLYHAFRTAANSAINPSTDDLGILGVSIIVSRQSYAYGINNSGQVVGYSPTSGNLYHAFRTAANSVINPSTDDLGTLGGNSSYALGINNSGQVVGQSDTSDGNVHAFRTAANSAIDPSTDDLGTLGGSKSYACGINNSGQVVGYSIISDGTDSSSYHAFLYDDNTMYDLNDLASTLDGFSYLKNAKAINDSGQIVGYGVLPNGSEHAFLATPVAPDVEN